MNLDYGKLLIFFVLYLLIGCKQTAVVIEYMGTEGQVNALELADTEEQVTQKPQSNMTVNEADVNITELPQTPPDITELSKQEWLQAEQIIDICEYYGLIDKILPVANEWRGESTSFVDILRYCDSTIKIYPNNNGKEAAVFYLGINRLYYYTMIIKDGNDWLLECTTHTIERGIPNYRVEWGVNSDHWLVFDRDAGHGTGISIFNEVWLDSGGNIAANFPVHGYSEFLMGTSGPPRDIAEFSSILELHGDEITIRYDVACLYIQSSEDPRTRFYLPPEYWVYNLRTGEFILTRCDFEFGEGFTYDPAYIDNGNVPMIGAYSRFYEQIAGDDGIDKLVTEKDWLELMQLGSGSVTPYPIEVWGD